MLKKSTLTIPFVSSVSGVWNETISDSTGNAYLASGGCGAVFVDVVGIDITLATTQGPIDQGESGMLAIHIDNPYPVYGIELHIQDTPESVEAIEVVATGPFIWIWSAVSIIQSPAFNSILSSAKARRSSPA